MHFNIINKICKVILLFKQTVCFVGTIVLMGHANPQTPRLAKKGICKVLKL